MSASAPSVKKLPEGVRRWLWRLLIAAAILSAIGYFSPQSAIPLMCKIYG
jgi:hypothetical protein